MSEFFHMGGYAFFVWTSYGIALVVLLANIILPMQRKKEILKNLKRRLRREQA
ncbi:MAG: heme exporter protein CcmD [Gammaproteobacteria bacterium]|nr:heme exporter protein CcmD [Gammaproteobacteria bacterium]